jgi:hypothetical protein
MSASRALSTAANAASAIISGPLIHARQFHFYNLETQTERHRLEWRGTSK